MTDSDVSKNGNDDEEGEEQENDADGGIRIGDIYIPPPPLPALTFDATGPRLMIEDILIENFKSYGGKVSLGPFQKNFSAIIGPNGSGKSNVIDALLFVFGYRAKKIRSKTVGVLVHNSDTHPNLTSCAVTIHFQKIIDKSPDEYDVVKNSKFLVSRTAHKDNSSYYTIDGRRVQFKEVSQLLRSHGIDLDHNRFLILQGEVEQISLMKPKSQTEHDTGMLEFLEDIIGSGRFEEPIEKLANKVKELNEQRGEKLNRVKIVEKEKDSLEGAKNEAVEYINVFNDSVKKKNILNQFLIQGDNVLMAGVVAKKKVIEDGMRDLLNKFKEINSQYNDTKVKLDLMTKKLVKYKKASDDMDLKFSDIEKMDARGRQDLKHANARTKELARKLAKDKTKLEELLASPAKLEEEIKELEKRREKLDTEKAKAQTKLEELMTSLHVETKTLQEEKDVHESELMKLQKGVNEAKSKMDVAQVEVDLCLKNEQDEKNKLEALQRNYETVLETIKEREASIPKLCKKVPELEASVVKSNDELEQVTIKENASAEQLRNERRKLEEAMSKMRASRERGSLLQALMNEKSSGRIPGIIGRLGDLGAIDAKYDVAISTACGSLNNIVTDTLETAQECVTLLKRNNLGHATFIALDKMKVWEGKANEKIKTPENVLRLFDLIKVNNKNVLPAFYFALRDTLVANDIHQATRIGLQGNTRHRVVTLKGELVDTSGAMSGGGSRQIRGLMGTAVVEDTCTQQQVDEMSNQCKHLDEQVKRLRELKMQLEELVIVQQKDADEAKHTLQKLKMEIEALTKQVPVIKASVSEQKNKVAASTSDKKKVEALTKTLNKLKLEFKNVNDAAAALKLKIQKITDEIKAISEGRIMKVQKPLDEISKNIDIADSDILKHKVAVKTTARNIEKTEEKIKITEVEAKENTDLIVKLTKDLKIAEVDAAKIMDDIKTKKMKIKDLEKHINTFQEELNVISSSKAEIDNEKLDVNHKLQQLDSQIEKYEDSIRSHKHQLSKLKLKSVDDEEQEVLPTLSETDLGTVDCHDLRFLILNLDAKLREMKPSLAAISEYKRKEQIYLERVEEFDRVTKDRDTQRHHHDDLRKQRLNEFMAGFQIISHKLKETYQMLTLGGDAELELVNSLDPFSDGIVFSVRPPRKSWKDISNLSGGEKTLSSLALVFALHYYKPTPFYVMDEIDAALDFRNVTIVAHYIKEQTKNAQFIVISLRNNLFELADRLVGVYKTYNSSHSVTLNPGNGQLEEARNV